MQTAPTKALFCRTSLGTQEKDKIGRETRECIHHGELLGQGTFNTGKDIRKCLDSYPL